ncbi:MAG: hypothetical protein CMM01_05265 [Rhodopirellula sp.]|nr:hypothetical protein [Rhodopirellula sp.]
MGVGIGRNFAGRMAWWPNSQKFLPNVEECPAEAFDAGLSGRNLTIVLAEFDDFMRCAGESCRYFFRLGSQEFGQIRKFSGVIR